MRGTKSIGKLIGLIIIVIVAGFLFYKNFQPQQGIRVTKWDNLYNENNIKLYYEDANTVSQNNNLQALRKTYKVDEILSKGETEIDKVLKTVDILNSIVEYDDVADSNLLDGYEILKEKDNKKKATGREMAVIERDLLYTAGFQARVGEFRKSEPQFQDTPGYYVVEYYSIESNKWVMIDFRHRAYFSKGDIKQSAIEVLKSDTEKLKFTGKDKYSEYKKEFKKYLSSYTISIDNTISAENSNSNITYITSEKDIDIMEGDKYLASTIFTKNKDIFSDEPSYEPSGKDKSTKLILLKKQEAKDSKNLYVIGAFRDSTVINNYYIKINNADWKLIDGVYYEYKLIDGENKIELSLDGKNTISTIIINKEI